MIAMATETYQTLTLVLLGVILLCVLGSFARR